MSTVMRVAGAAGTFDYTLSVVPTAVPKLTIYSDPARTAVAVAQTDTVATANPAVFRCAFPGTLPAGTYYLQFLNQFAFGEDIDTDDQLILQAVIGTPTGSVVTVDQYRAITHDTATSDADVETALADAVALVELNLQRALTSQQRTESVRLITDANGFARIWPSATPVTAVPTGFAIDPGGASVRGLSFLSGSSFLTNLASYDPYPILVFTYTGGFTTESLPVKLRRGIALLAREFVREPPGVPAGATSVRSGDVSVAFRDAYTPTLAVDTILRSLRGFRPRRVIG